MHTQHACMHARVLHAYAHALSFHPCQHNNFYTCMLVYTNHVCIYIYIYIHIQASHTHVLYMCVITCFFFGLLCLTNVGCKSTGRGRPPPHKQTYTHVPTCPQSLVFLACFFHTCRLSDLMQRQAPHPRIPPFWVQEHVHLPTLHQVQPAHACPEALLTSPSSCLEPSSTPCMQPTA